VLCAPAPAAASLIDLRKYTPAMEYWSQVVEEELTKEGKLRLKNKQKQVKKQA
jgi:hypothetical protein